VDTYVKSEQSLQVMQINALRTILTLFAIKW